ncbi:MAG: MATE family efflux transporter [Candidatus Omnitrophica bacterium]|jgi:Na+-driven multidrug efflux pump|nr:MATE family efflux transporter [Candidatus Omnitrophota bacterium]
MDKPNLNQNNRIKSIIAESWSIGWPMTLIMFFEFLIGLTDVYVAGRFGKEVQAAYGIAFQLYFIFIIIGIAFSVGSVSVISRLFTSEKKDEFAHAVNSSFLASGMAGIVFTLIGIIFSKTIINLLGIPQALKGYAAVFLTIYSAGFVFDYILLNTNGTLRACKMIKKSLWTMAIACSLNVVLDFVLAFHTPLGFKGISVATVISLFVGTVLNIAYVKRIIRISFEFSLPVIKKILNISWPSGVLQIVWQLGVMAIFLILNALPHNNIEVIAAFTNGLRIESAIFLPAFAFNMANAVLVGNLLGKNKKEEAVHIGATTAGLGVFIIIILALIVLFNAKHIAFLLSDNPIVIEECIKYIYISLIFEPFMAWGIILGGGLNGAGDTKSVMFIVTGTLWFIRIPLAFILGISAGFGPVGVWWAMNVSIFVQAALMSMRYFTKKWLLNSEQVISQ